MTITVYRMPEHELQSFLASRIPRLTPRPTQLITSPELEPIRVEWSPWCRRHTMNHFRRRCAESRARRRRDHRS